MARCLKIVFFVQFFPPVTFGGTEFQFFEYAKEFANRGHEVHVVTQRVKGASSYGTVSGVVVHHVGLPVTYRGTLPKVIPDSLSYVLLAIWSGLHLAKVSKVDVFHSTTPFPAIAGSLCSLLTGVPHIMTVHDVFSIAGTNFIRKWSAQQKLSRIGAAAIPALERLILNLPAAVIHTVSDTSKKDLGQFNASDRTIVVIPNGISLRDYKSVPELDSRKHQAVFVGRLVFYKNLETLMVAWKEVVRCIPGAKLVIMGNGPMRESLKSLATNLGIPRSVEFLGWVDHITKLRSLTGSSILVFPSVREGFGIVILEAFACSRPVIVSDLPPMNELVEDSVDGLAVDPYDAKAWAESIVTLLQSPSLCEKMASHGLAKVQKSYTIQSVVNRFERLYLDVCSGVKSP